jgi:hypothetical protein
VTPPGGRGLAALALAVVLGVCGGAVTAYLVQDDATPQADGPDPLDVGVPLANLACNPDQTVVIVGSGNTASDLRYAVRDWDQDGVKYLETAKSCDTAWPPEAGEVPQYVAYLPPFDSNEAACEERMQSSHKGDAATRLREGNDDTVVCPCELDRAMLPEIGGEGQELTPASAMWTYTYQRMLAKVGLLDLDDVEKSVFDDATIAATRVLQTDIPINPVGSVTVDTWSELRDRACPLYDY